jgi:CRISPR-associated endoribonuclease Cas6
MLAVIHVPWLHKNKARTSHEGALYAALDCIGGGNPALAQALHNNDGPPPYSARLENGILRLGALTSEIILALDRSRVVNKAEIVRYTTFEQLLDEAVPSPTLRLDFVTPTAFGHSGMSHVLPEPRLVFGSLDRRWQLAGGPAGPEVDWTAVIVIHTKLETRRAEVGRYVQWGTTGHAIYRLLPEHERWASALAAFATYSGVGQRTSQGFGQVEYDAERSAEISTVRANERT